MASLQKDNVHLTRRDEEAIDRVKHLVTADLKQHHTIPELARRVHLNECKLKAGFKKMYGTGIWAYLSELRLQTACGMLRGTDLSVKEVAYALGYRYVANFITCFKRRYGLTPGEEKRKEEATSAPEIKTNTPEIKGNAFGGNKGNPEF